MRFFSEFVELYIEKYRCNEICYANFSLFNRKQTKNTQV